MGGRCPPDHAIALYFGMRTPGRDLVYLSVMVQLIDLDNIPRGAMVMRPRRTAPATNSNHGAIGVGLL